MVREIEILLLIPDPLDNPSAVKKVLELLEAEPELAPSHVGEDERKRELYSRDRALEIVPKMKGHSLLLWPKQSSKEVSAISLSSFIPSAVNISLGKKFRLDRVQSIFEACNRVAEELRSPYGQIFLRHEECEKGGDLEAYFGTQCKRVMRPGVMYYTGLTGVQPRMWFDAEIVECIGETVLSSLGTVSPRPAGGLRLDVVPEPWNATPEVLLAAMLAANDKLREAGLISVTRAYDHWVAPNWKRPASWTCTDRRIERRLHPYEEYAKVRQP